ncbi:MAG TPA: YceI family protein [Puia sp.]|jgi:polyisoprenoid-binding protein YceI|nr:YceI family protein [Puia sp.]
MKKLFYPVAAVLILAGSAFTFLTAPGWQIDKPYSIGFSIGNEAGIFKDFQGTILFDDQNPGAGKFDVSVKVASVNTGNGLQNTHIKSGEWLDADNYPQILFTSSSIGKKGNGYEVTGQLDLHGVKKTITFPFTFQKSGQAAGTFTGNFTINRNDYKIGKPGGDVADQIKIDISVPVKKI